MAQPRIAPVGFGGAPPGVGILQAVAEGNLKREDREQEMQMQAIRQRLMEAQADRMATLSRHAEEDRAQAAVERERAETAFGAATENLKAYFVEQGMDPSQAENEAIARLEGLTSRADIEKEQANLEQVRSSTASNQVSTQGRQLENQRTRTQIDAATLLGDPDFIRRASDPEFDIGTLTRATQTQFPDLTPEAISLAVRQVRGFREGAIDPLGQGEAEGRVDRDQVSIIARKNIEKFGSVEEALRAAHAALPNVPAEKRAHAEAVIKELERRVGGSAATGSGNVRLPDFPGAL